MYMYNQAYRLVCGPTVYTVASGWLQLSLCISIKLEMLQTVVNNVMINKYLYSRILHMTTMDLDITLN